jgi:hypothetical protein
MRMTLLAAIAAIGIGLAGPSGALAAPVNTSVVGQTANVSAPVLKAWCKVHRWCEMGRCWVHRHCW